ncbi:MAG: site-specific integrase [Deltaproteobacteria bacterium]|nr:site-specific integrase [Deltaproteobacteria bacterium]
MTKKLTKVLIDTLRYWGDEKGKQWCVAWDAEVPGFGVRVHPGGRKVFILRYRTSGGRRGRKRFLTLGPYGTLTLDQARKLARQHLGDVLRGEDPVQKKEQSLGETVESLCQMYLERHAMKKRSARDDHRRIAKYILPLWRRRRVADISRVDVAALHSRIGQQAPYEANRVLALCSKIFELARGWGFAAEEWSNPARGIDKFQERSRDRWVTPEELPRLAEAIARENNIYSRALLWLYLLTGLRKRELLSLRWDDVDLVRYELRIPETKSGRIHHVPLPPPAVSLIALIPREHENPFVFPGKNPDSHLVSVERPWRRIRKVAGLSDVRLHDIRRTVGSWLALAGNSLPVIGRVLNHRDPRTTTIYTHLAEDHVRQVLENYAGRITQAAGPWFPVPTVTPALPLEKKEHLTS